MRFLLSLFALGTSTLLSQALNPEMLPLNERVMVVYNAASDDSRKIANYYMAKRNIPKANLCKVDTEKSELQEAKLFEPEIKKPIRACLEKLGKQNILYILFSFEMPYAANYAGHPAAVDQLVADIWDEYTPAGTPGGQVDQPYFGKAESQGNIYEPFVSLAKYRAQPTAKTIYSVWRLDGPNAQTAQSLVDKAIATEAKGLHGKAYFDMRTPMEGVADKGYGSGDWDVFQSSQMARKAGFDVTVDNKETEFGTAPSLLKCENAALYTGWYSLGHYNDAFTWAPGAIGFHLDSASATNPRGGPSWVAGALQRGITVTSGSVTEPYLEGLVHPDQIFLYLFEGANVGDAVLRGTHWLKWMIVNVGDPLYTPFPKGIGFYATPAPRLDGWFGVSPNSLVGEGTVRAQFSLGQKMDKATPVVFSSNYPALVKLPASVNLPPGANGAQFAMSVKSPDEPVSLIVKITAGDEVLSNTVNLYPILADLTLSQPSVKAGGVISATVSLLMPAKEAGFSIRLTSNQPAVIIPEVVKVPPGARTATFPIGSKSVAAEVTAAITAKFDNAAKTVQLKITP